MPLNSHNHLSSFLERESQLRGQLLSPDGKLCYEKLLAMGRSLPSFPAIQFCQVDRVPGCQSILFFQIHPSTAGTLRLYAKGDALIARGLAACVWTLYDDLTPQVILEAPTHWLEPFKAAGALSMGRSAGLLSLMRLLYHRAQFTLLQST